MPALSLTIDEETGALECVWDDELADVLEAVGEVTVTRASMVEPHTLGGWTAQMIDGPELFDTDGKPFRLRSQALAAERQWLAENRGL